MKSARAFVTRAGIPAVLVASLAVCGPSKRPATTWTLLEQEVERTPVTARAPVVVVPFRMVDGLMVVEARIRRIDTPVRLAIDTGMGPGLNWYAERRLGYSVDVVLNDYELPRVRVAQAPPRLVRAVVEHGAFDGFIGADLFEGRIVRIDFDHERIEVFARVDEHAAGPVGAVVAPMSVDDGRPFVMLTVPTATGWQRHKARLATGYARDVGLPNLASCDGPETPGRLARVSRARVEGAVVNDALVACGAGSNDKDAVVGLGFLRRFNATFDFDRQRLYLESRAGGSGGGLVVAESAMATTARP